MERCFQLAVSIDLQAAASGYKAIAGVTSGLIGAGNTVTWQGRSFGRTVTHQSLIDVWHPYIHFHDIMIAGPFASYEHDHHFAPLNDGTRIRDEIRFSTPRGIWGRLAERLFLHKQIAVMLKRRNLLIKKAAESEQWHEFLDGQSPVDMRVFQATSVFREQPERNVYAD
jgi:ligand-binding SRPBCC domain-containing protein